MDDTENEYKMPLLANLPLLGKFFSHTDHATRKTDLLIQITPRIVREGISYSDARNLTSQGNHILNQGDVVNMEKIFDSEAKDINQVKSDVKQLEGDLDKVKVPLSERLKEQGY